MSDLAIWHQLRKNCQLDIDEAVLVWPDRFKGGDKYVEQHFDLAYSEPSGRLW
jgi:hypothetical protein